MDNNSKIKPIIGFTNEYYTLWLAHDERVHIKNGFYSVVTFYKYIQNLSKQVNEAVSKVMDRYSIENIEDVNIDTDLRGEDHIKYLHYKPTDFPHLFQFGKYECMPINISEDGEYIKWYICVCENEKSVNVAKARILELNYKLYSLKDGSVEYLTPDQYECKVREITEHLRIDNLLNGYHFEDKERVELELREIDSFTFEGVYGTTWVITFESKCGKLFKYIGRSCFDIPQDQFIKVKATINHSEYQGKLETKLQRIKLC